MSTSSQRHETGSPAVISLSRNPEPADLAPEHLLVDDDFEVIGSISSLANENGNAGDFNNSFEGLLSNLTIAPLIAPSASTARSSSMEVSGHQKSISTTQELTANKNSNAVVNSDKEAKTIYANLDSEASNKSNAEGDYAQVPSNVSTIRDSLTVTSSDGVEPDPVLMIESIKFEYSTALGALRAENDVVRKALKEKCDEATELKRRLETAKEENLRMNNELSSAKQSLKDINMKYDQVVAQNLDSADKIKILEQMVQQLRDDGNGTSFPASLITSLEAKDRQINELTERGKEMEALLTKEQEKALDLEEIVKVLHEQNCESEQILRQSQEEFQYRIEELQQKIRSYEERGGSNCA